MCVNEKRYKEESSVRVSVYGVVYDNGGGNIWSNVCPYFIVYTELFRAAQTLLLADLNTHVHIYLVYYYRNKQRIFRNFVQCCRILLYVHTHTHVYSLMNRENVRKKKAIMAK